MTPWNNYVHVPGQEHKDLELWQEWLCSRPLRHSARLQHGAVCRLPTAIIYTQCPGQPIPWPPPSGAEPLLHLFSTISVLQTSGHQLLNVVFSAEPWPSPTWGTYLSFALVQKPPYDEERQVPRLEISSYLQCGMQKSLHLSFPTRFLCPTSSGELGHNDQNPRHSRQRLVFVHESCPAFLQFTQVLTSKSCCFWWLT